MGTGLRVVLLVFALVGFAGAGASLAVSRYRQWTDGERDMGMLGVAAMLLVFGILCTAVAAGFAGVVAFGGVASWASYIMMAQHLGVFRVEARDAPWTHEEHTEEPRSLT